MAGNPRDGVFLSYARKDGEEFATRLRQRITADAPDVPVLQDRSFLEGGIGWWKQIEAAIDSAAFLVLAMTPSAMASAVVRKEWRHARQQGVCVYPVKAAPDSELQFAALPRWMRKAHFYDLDHEWENFVAHLRGGCRAPRVPFMAPDLPEYFVQRQRELDQLKTYLLATDAEQGTPPIAVTGGGGFGKSTFAAALCHDEDVIEHFDDGILWVKAGRHGRVISGLAALYTALTGEHPAFADEREAVFELGKKLEHLNCLIVIDDVWDAASLRGFMQGGKGSARLFTTRNAAIAASAGTPLRVDLDQMRESEGAAILTRRIPHLSAAQGVELSNRFGGWPIALEVAAAQISARVSLGEPVEAAMDRLLKRIERKGVGVLEIGPVLEPSMELLSIEERTRFAQLSIFPAGIAIPIAVAGELWGVDEFEAGETAERLAQLSLMKVDLGRATLRVHDVVRSWLAPFVSNPADLHNALLSHWSDWFHLPHEYAWRWLSWHLAQSERTDDLRRLLWNLWWLQFKLEATDIYAMVADFEHLAPERNAELMIRALHLSAHAVSRDKNQLWGQLFGRLLGLRPFPLFDPNHKAPQVESGRIFLFPYVPSLEPPGQVWLRTLTGHSCPIHSVAVDETGRRAISGGDDGSLKIWDLDTGLELRTLTGHERGIELVILIGAGRRAVSASAGGNIRFWDLESGEQVGSIATGKENHILAVSPDGRMAMAAVASSDLLHASDPEQHLRAFLEKPELKVWDLETGAIRATLSGHTASVRAVGFSSDGTRAVSASEDGTLKCWDLAAGAAVRTFAGHKGGVYAAAFFAGDTRILSASADNTMKVWETATGADLLTIPFRDSVQAIYADGRRAIASFGMAGSVSQSNLRIWDVERNVELATLPGHVDSITAVAVSADGRRAVSASSDQTVKVWDLEGQALSPIPHHEGRVTSVAMSKDGKRACSSSWDGTLALWDMEAGRQLATCPVGMGWRVHCAALFEGGAYAIAGTILGTLNVCDFALGWQMYALEGEAEVNAVALYGEGKRVVSACNDGTLKLWDLETGGETRRIQAHEAPVYSISVFSGGTRAISGSADQTLKVWDLETGQQVQTLSGHTDSVFGVTVMGGDRLAISGSRDCTVRVWDLETGAELRTLRGHTSQVNAVAALDQARYILSASWDHTVRLWDLKDGTIIAAYTGDGPFSGVASASGQIFAGDALGRVHFLRLMVTG